MNKLYSKIASLSVGLAMAIGVGVAVSSESKPVKAESYVLVTDPSTLTNGSSVFIAMKDGNAPSTGVTGFSGNKDATVSANSEDWVSYEIKDASEDGWKLYDAGAEKYIATPTDNHFKYDAAGGTCSVTSDGSLFCNDRILMKNGNNYRFYKSASNYEHFYVWKINVPTRTLSSIDVTTPPTKTSYKVGESFDPTGMVVTAHFSDADDAVISNDKLQFDPVTLTAGVEEVNINYTEKDITKSASVPVSVITVTDVTGVTKAPSEVKVGKSIKLSDVELSVKYSDDSTGTVNPTSIDCNTSVAATQVTATAHYDDASGVKEATFKVNVVEQQGYDKISGAFEEGSYVLTDATQGKAVTAALSSDRLVSAAVSPVNDSIEEPAESMIWVASQSGEYWTFFNESTSKYLGSTNSKNTAALLEDADSDFALWTVSENEGKYDLVNKGRAGAQSDSNNCHLRANTNMSDKPFACYASSMGENLTLYGKLAPKASLLSIDIDVTGAKTVYTVGDAASKDGVKVIGNYDDSTTKELKDAVITVSPATIAQDTEFVTYSCTYQEKQAEAKVNISIVTLESISLSGTATKTAYRAGEKASSAGLVVTATYSVGDPVDVTSEAVISANPTTVALDTKTIKFTAAFGGKTSNDVVVDVTVSARDNDIQAIYSKEKGAAIDAYGFYVGFLDGTGPVIMDGEWGIVIYNYSADVSSYEAGKTVLHVTGSLDIYSGLYELKNTTITVSENPGLSSPVTHVVNGDETAQQASRLTSLTGVPTAVTSGDLTKNPGTADIKLTFSVNEKSVNVFYKKAAQSKYQMKMLKAALDEGSSYSLNGFTSWYNGFQVQMGADVFSAEDFAEELLSKTDNVCAGWKEGDNNHDAIASIWADLKENAYSRLKAAEIEKLAKAETEGEGSIAKAMERYDFLTGKYNLENFISGRVIDSAYYTGYDYNAGGVPGYVIIVIISSFVAISFGVALMLRKKKHSK